MSADVAEPRPGEKCPECGAVVFECAACEAWVCSCDGSVAPCHGCGRVTCPNCGHIKGEPVVEVVMDAVRERARSDAAIPARDGEPLTREAALYHDATKTGHGDELDGVDFDACRALLLDETGAGR